MLLHRVTSAVGPASRRARGRGPKRQRPDYHHELRATELRETLQLAPSAALPPAFAVSLIVIAFQAHPSRDALVALALVICLVVMAAMVAARKALPAIATDRAMAIARRWAITAATLIGVGTGLFPLLLFAGADPWQRLALLGCLAAVCADVFLVGPIVFVWIGLLAPVLIGTGIGMARGGGADAGVLLAALPGLTLVVSIALRHLHRLTTRRIVDGFLADDLDQTVEALLLDFDETRSDWIFDLDVARRLRAVPVAMALAAQRPVADLDGVRFVSLFRDARRMRTAIADRQPFRDEILEIASGDGSIWWRVSAKPTYDRDGAFLGYRGIGSDITEARNSEARASYLASCDSLTGLANREQFTILASRECRAAAIDGHWRALLYLDLDGFKSVNDGFGHAAGDAVLKAVARRMETRIDGALLARLGGDEFAIWLPSATPAKAEALATALIEVVSVPFDVHGMPVSIGVSIGIAYTPKHGIDPDTLLGRADLALYRAKADGKNIFRVFVEAYELSLIERRKLQDDLRLAVARQEFELHYQPLVDLTLGRIVGFEALIRWHSPTRGFVAPVDFIPAAERSGQIGAIGGWVLTRACMDAAGWLDDVSIAVNVSPQQVRAPDFVQTVLIALKASGLAPTRLELEVTESVFLDDSPLALTNLRALRERGIRIALDDFGTGYSSLSYLINFPVDKIKIDRSFVRDCATRHENQTVVDAILTIARKLSIHVTAEGVETVDQALALKLRRCDDIQGYLFSQARPLSDVPALFETIPARFREVFPLGFASPLGLSLAMKRNAA